MNGMHPYSIEQRLNQAIKAWWIITDVFHRWGNAQYCINITRYSNTLYCRISVYTEIKLWKYRTPPLECGLMSLKHSSLFQGKRQDKTADTGDAVAMEWMINKHFIANLFIRSDLSRDTDSARAPRLGRYQISAELSNYLGDQKSGGSWAGQDYQSSFYFTVQIDIDKW